ncbi:RVP_2 domain-containing protein [Gossypium australe]|uniref:RVP_2 domain-containing protein n=1 Tax=Gossypium australe TaxID=47621 RepID=A0A5B6VW03_9ROSI|nr:RVP_2 domain-containing protein [Gossypium australe]
MRDEPRTSIPRPQTTFVASVRSVRNVDKPVCGHCGRNHKVVNCKQKRISLKSIESDLVNVETSLSKCPTNIITTMSAQELIKKGCEAYEAYVLDLRISESGLDQVLTELLGLLPKEEVNFVIEVALKTTPISIALYRLALAELKKLKA